jgi:hypothetical protein
MAAQEEIKNLESDQELGFQQREWRAERTGWAIMAAVVLLSLIGLFGDGPISQATQVGEGGCQLTYERFTRNTSSSVIMVGLPENSIQKGQASFWIDRDYLDGIQIDDISPEPDSTVIEQGRTMYVFAAGESAFPREVKFDITTESSGIKKGSAGCGDQQVIQFSQIVFP